MDEALLWVKVVHILGVIAWMAGLFYLPRLFVYHSTEPVGSNASELFKIMERRLIKAIMRPACVVAIIAGLTLAWGYSIQDFWMVIKMVAVSGLVLLHVFLEHCVKAYAADGRPYTSRQFRIINEVPTVLLVIIIVMVVIKPFA